MSTLHYTENKPKPSVIQNIFNYTKIFWSTAAKNVQKPFGYLTIIIHGESSITLQIINIIKTAKWLKTRNIQTISSNSNLTLFDTT